MSRYAYFGVINALSMIALDLGVEPHEVIELANHEYPRKLHGKPGFTAGTCLRKDFGMLAENYWSGSFLTEMWRINESLPKYLVDLATERYGSLHGPARGRAGLHLQTRRRRRARFARSQADPLLAARDAGQDRRQRSVHPGRPGRAVSSSWSSRPTWTTALADAEFVFIATNHSLYAQQNARRS